jgi:NADPH:quinone reductase-like Zn-dependent oxidoreductase
LEIHREHHRNEHEKPGPDRVDADARIIACGSISNYNAEKPRPGPSNLFNMITKRLTMKGLLVRDWLDRQSEFENEVGGYFKAGKLTSKETVVKGIEQAVGAFLGLFEGRNVGKMVVELALSRAVSWATRWAGKLNSLRANKFEIIGDQNDFGA